MSYCGCTCPSCGGLGTYGGGFPCSGCLSGGYYLTPQGGLSLTPGPGYTGPYYPAGDPQPGGTCPLCGGACHIAPRVVFSLSVDGEPIGIREIRGNVKNGEVVRALEMVRQNNDSLLEWWREIHGDC